MILLGVGKATPQPIAIEGVSGKSPVVPAVGDSGRAGETLIVIEEDPVVANVSELIRIEEELRRTNMHATRVFVADIQIAGKTLVLIVGGKFATVYLTLAIIEG